jgi:signal peptide peptidase SppA
MRDFELANCTAALCGEPWAIQPAKLTALVEILAQRKAGARPSIEVLEGFRQSREEMRAKSAAPGWTIRDAAGMPVRQSNGVAVLPLYGTVVQRPGIFTRYCGGASCEQFAAAHAELVADSSVSAIIWDVDSPGGSVAGVPESADKLYAMRGQKKTVAVSNTLMASAAYWLASAADEIVAAPSSLTGSIGVYMVHEDHSRANAVAGVGVTYVSAGKKKVDGNSDSPLSPSALTSLQEMVDDYYGQFVAAVARNRRASQVAVKSGFGEGDTLTAERAVGARLADRVDTLEGVVGKLVRKADRGSSAGHAANAAAAMRHAAALDKQ